MKKFAIAILFTYCHVLAISQDINIIPKPNKITVKDGTFILNASTVIVAADEENNSVNFLNDYLKNYYGFTLKKAPTAAKNFIHLSTQKKVMAGTQGAYGFVSNPISINISGETLQGTFYGVQSLLQLLPVLPTASSLKGMKMEFKIPCVEITDEPRFQYRGLMLDAGRHFFPVSFIKKYIDYIALFKLNTFHWHLTEDQGWRIEIKRYPKLTTVGGFRNGTIIGHNPGTANDNQPDGGFYTQDEVKEIVQYAKDRFITIIPEIEMPGHSSAAIAAYPELSCFPNEATNLKSNPSNASKQAQANGAKKMVQESWGVFEDVYCPSDTTFHFLENVLDEVMALFPSQYIHIGGDECPKEAWKRSNFCQKLIKEKGLKNEQGLQSYFIQKIEAYINSKGKKIIGWDEILEGGLAANATVMSWRGEQGGIDATKQGHDVIMTPNEFVYFDYSQTQHEDSLTIGGYLPLEKVYGYDPIPAALSGDEAKHVLGAQANLWTEYIGNTGKAEYMLFPRLAALSEVLWTKLPYKNYADFENRLPNLFQKFDYMKVSYSKAFYEIKTSVMPSYNYDGIIWKLGSKKPNTTFQFATPDAVDSKTEMIKIKVPDFAKDRKGKILKDTLIEYNGNTLRGDTVLVKKPGVYTANEMIAGRKTGNTFTQTFFINKATGKKVNVAPIASNDYPGNGAFTLVDGIQNDKGVAASSEFIGFNAKDCNVLLDLGKPDTINNVSIHYFTSNNLKSYAPKLAEIWGSADGLSYKDIAHTSAFDNSKPNGILKLTVTDKQKIFRYLRISIKNNAFTNGSAAPSNTSWLLLDEVEVL